MTLPLSGPISMLDLKTEYNAGVPIKINDYYYGGSLVPQVKVGKAPTLPQSGQISLADFRGNGYPRFETGDIGISTASLLGSAISNPATDGNGTVVFRTSNSTQRFTYRSTNGGMSFQRVDPAQSKTGGVGTMLYANGRYVDFNSDGTCQQSTDLVNWYNTTFPALPNNSTLSWTVYYWANNGPTQSSVPASGSETYTRIPPVAANGYIILGYYKTRIESIPGYTDYYSGYHAPVNTTTKTYYASVCRVTEVGIEVAPYVATGGTTPIYGSVNGVLFKCVSGTIMASLDGSSWSTVTTLKIDGLNYAPVEGSFHYDETLGYLFIEKRTAYYDGSGWVWDSGLCIWQSLDGAAWNLICNTTLTSICTPTYGSLGTIQVVVGAGKIVVVPEPKNYFPAPNQWYYSSNGSSWQALAVPAWPASTTFAGVCWSGSTLVATSFAFRAVVSG